MALTNSAMRYIIYPIKILFKSSKPIPVMLISAVVFGKKYSAAEYVCVGVMVFGIIIFAAEQAGFLKDMFGSSGDDDKSGDDDGASSMMMFGVLMMAGAVVADGFLSNLSANTFAK